MLIFSNIFEYKTFNVRPPFIEEPPGKPVQELEEAYSVQLSKDLPKRASAVRVMTKKLNMLTTIRLTSIEV